MPDWAQTVIDIATLALFVFVAVNYWDQRRRP